MTDRNVDPLFKEDDIIFSYTSEDAVNDGTLIHPYPARWPWLLISLNVSMACEPTEDDPREYDQKLVPLLMDCILKAQASGSLDDAPLVLEHTVAGTVWIGPNDMGGMTVYTPDEY